MRQAVPDAVPVCDFEVDPDPRVAFAERDQQRRHEMLGRGGRHPQPEPARALLRGRARAPFKLLDESEESPPEAFDLAAGLGEHEAAAAPFDHLDTQIALQRGQRRRDRRLRNDQPLGGDTNRAGTRDFEERPELMQRYHKLMLINIRENGI